MSETNEKLKADEERRREEERQADEVLEALDKIRELQDRDDQVRTEDLQRQDQQRQDQDRLDHERLREDDLAQAYEDLDFGDSLDEPDFEDAPQAQSLSPAQEAVNGMMKDYYAKKENQNPGQAEVVEVNPAQTQENAGDFTDIYGNKVHRAQVEGALSNYNQMKANGQLAGTVQELSANQGYLGSAAEQPLEEALPDGLDGATGIDKQGLQIAANAVDSIMDMGVDAAPQSDQEADFKYPGLVERYAQEQEGREAEPELSEAQTATAEVLNDYQERAANGEVMEDRTVQVALGQMSEHEEEVAQDQAGDTDWERELDGFLEEHGYEEKAKGNSQSTDYEDELDGFMTKQRERREREQQQKGRDR